jgi:hypothetical protein
VYFAQIKNPVNVGLGAGWRDPERFDLLPRVVHQLTATGLDSVSVSGSGFGSINGSS